MNKNLRIVFMGTPEFAVTILDAIVKSGYNVVGVVTVPDKPAGRGQQLHQSAVKQYALQHNLPLLQPEKLRDENFITALKNWNADLQIVVAFRMLPQVVWAMPAKGTFNLHASLLPQYRGAAPINWAIINGEKESGVTTFFLDEHIDTGKIILNEKVTINPNDCAGDLHDNLMNTGAKLVVKTIDLIEQNKVEAQPQNLFAEAELKHAPKIFKDDCKINWTKNPQNIINLIRGLSPYPTAFTNLSRDGEIISVKVFKAEFLEENHSYKIGTVISDNKNYLKVAVNSGFINLLDIQLAGKKRLAVQELLKGFKLNENTFVE
ncbi:MAG: methionyl-tRNA formyltransferase [Bacteroidota bacterium]